MARSPWCPALLCLALGSVLVIPSDVSGAPADPLYVITDLSSGLDYPTAINASSDVVGQSSVPCGDGSLLSCNRAFVYSSSTGLATELGVIGDGSVGYYSTAHGINAAGDAVGSSPESVPDFSYPGCAVLYPADGGRECLLPGTRSVALAINDSGLVVGYAYTSLFVQQAFLYDRNTGSRTDIHAEIVATNPGATGSQATAINAVGDVVGWFRDGTWRAHAFVRHPDGSFDFLLLPDGIPDTDTEPTGVNTSGQVVATTNMTSGSWPMKAVLWSGGAAQDLGTLSSPHGVPPASTALGINGQGEIVGGSSYEFYCSGGPSGSCGILMHAFLYSNGVMQDFNDLIPPDSGWVLYAATAINDGGQIVAHGRHSSGGSGAVLLTRSPGTMIGSLIRLVRGFDLPGGIANSLVTKLENAQAALAAGDTAAACELLRAFINETRAQSGKKLTTEQADEMIASAEQIRAAIGCP